MHASAPPQLPYLLRRRGQIVAADANSLVSVEVRTWRADLNTSRQAKP